ncbi:MAG: TraR/DksA family transcriptional regulator [Bacteroidota bacterium]
MAKKTISKPTKKAAKPVAKKAAPKKVAKPVAKKAAPKKVAKPAPKKAAPKKVTKPAPKKAAPKKVAKPVAKKAVVKVAPKKAVAKAPVNAVTKHTPKPVVVSKPAPAPVSKSTIKPIIQPVRASRYSDKDLKEFEALIKQKLIQARSDYDELKESLSRDGDNSTDDTSPTFKMMEDGSDTSSREEVAQLAARQEKFIKSLENALLRIMNKTYGVCRVTGKLIPKERLRLVPHATLSIEAKNMQ